MSNGCSAIATDRRRAVHRDRDQSRKPARFSRGIRGTISLAERVAFADLNGRQTAWTGDRTEFIGRDGAIDRPAASERLERNSVQSRRCGARSRAARCKPMSGLSRVRHNGNRLLSRRGGNGGATRNLFLQSTAPADLDAVFARVTRQWDEILGIVQVKTPDRAWIFSSTDGFPTRRLPAGYGRAPASIRRVAPMAFAISCRMSWRCA